jgi:Uma2 family endonuclease
MGLPAAVGLTVEQYFGWEARQPDKYEYLYGEVLAMVGVTRRRATVAGNVFNLVATHLGDGLCRAYMSDMKLRVEAANASSLRASRVTAARSPPIAP